MTKILIVDDDGDFRASTGAFLRASGLDVVEAQSGDEGVRMAEVERPDLIVMDIMMSERTEGLFAVKRLRATPGFEKVPVFVVSSLFADIAGVPMSPEREWVGHDEFFPKPLDLPGFLEKVQAYTSEEKKHENPKAS
jgi:CheY-like chemotaxis protein